MPTMMRIFAGIKYKDQKLGQCTFIDNIDELPFVKRCTGGQLTGTLVCAKHALSVTFIDTNGSESTKYFNGIKQADQFRKTVQWTETNYRLAPVNA